MTKPILTVVESIYYSNDREDPIDVGSRFMRTLDSEEQPYIRRLSIGEEWVPLDYGWIKEVSSLSIHNEGNLPAGTIPSSEEINKESCRILEIAVVPLSSAIPLTSFIVRAGESFRGCPSSLNLLRLRCRKGITRVCISIIPA